MDEFQRVSEELKKLISEFYPNPDEIIKDIKEIVYNSTRNKSPAEYFGDIFRKYPKLHEYDPNKMLNTLLNFWNKCPMKIHGNKSAEEVFRESMA